MRRLAFWWQAWVIGPGQGGQEGEKREWVRWHKDSEGIAASVEAHGDDCGHLKNLSSAIMGGPMEGVSDSQCVESGYDGSTREEVRIRGQLRAILMGHKEHLAGQPQSLPSQ